MDSQQYALTHDHQANNLAIPQQQHILGVTRGELGKEVLLSLNSQGEINAHPFISPLLKERTTWFKLDDGNDDAIGNWQQKNLFEVGAGTKKFTGGRYADSFLLMGKAAPVQPSIFDGGSDPASPVPLDDNDIVMAMAKYIDGWGYYRANNI
ncbi:hypothetical protein [Candidatus Regiella insecticola]|uniref:Putative RTX-family protein-28 n=1 Tax=Candidatus Regiella insecticola TaxID=138073 RepID=A0A6L2ZMS6_9ENTR|nr:hypothetical protein [Candidatus Regiella insecticola]GFN45551.1 putative RTX-family protein-28 [Candidatus Regiella insecticola]